MRLLYSHKLTGYTFDPRIADAMRDYINKWQNPETGCWGQWLVDRYGRVWKMDDTGITFHIISDLHGQVQHLSQIARRLIELDKSDYPAGRRMSGHYENHLNWDLVIVFRYAWPSLDEPTRARVRDEIQRMLDWCLSQSLQADGSFKTSEIDDTLRRCPDVRSVVPARCRLLRSGTALLDRQELSRRRGRARPD